MKDELGMDIGDRGGSFYRTQIVVEDVKTDFDFSHCRYNSRYFLDDPKRNDAI